MAAIEERLQVLLKRAVDGLSAIDGVHILPAGARRTSTISFTVDGLAPEDIATRLAAQDVWVWNGDNYAYELMKRFGLDDSGGAVRASIVVYNDESDVDRLIAAVAGLRG